LISLTNRPDTVQYLKISLKVGHLAGWPALEIFNLDCIIYQKSDCQRIWNLMKMEMSS